MFLAGSYARFLADPVSVLLTYDNSGVGIIKGRGGGGIDVLYIILPEEIHSADLWAEGASALLSNQEALFLHLGTFCFLVAK